MATGDVIISVVDVGQGQCTFVEIYNTSNTLTNTLLLDCGSDKTSDQTDANLDYIVTKVSGMSPPTIDCIVFSHSDKDHISLTKSLLDKFSSSKKPTVGMVWYGGNEDNYTKYNFNILQHLATKNYCAKSDIHSLNTDCTGYNNTTHKFTHHLWESTDKTVKLYPIVANVESNTPNRNLLGPPPKKKKKAEELNRVSIVCGLYYNDLCYVICGDATNKTMAAINAVFSVTGSTPPVFKYNVMTTLPHHGSRATGFAVSSSATASTAATAVVATFAQIVQSKSISISSYEKHHHPSLELMDYFVPTVTTPVVKDPRLTQDNAHRIQCYYDKTLTVPSTMSLTKGLSYTFDTKSNVFGTRYSGFIFGPYLSYQIGSGSAQLANGVKSNQAINAHASWIYTTRSDGSAGVMGFTNLEATGPFTASATTAVASAMVRRGEDMEMAAEPVTDHDERQAEPAEASPHVRVKRKGNRVRRPARPQRRLHRQLQTAY